MKENKVMKLEEGMYVRFKDKRGSHYIRKITSVNTEYPGKLYAGIYIDKTANNCNGVSSKNIISASHRLIDLIDKGDYVNGYKVLEVTEQYIKLNNPKSNYDCIEFERIFKNKYSNINIFDVVTKEQFNSMKYEVKEDE